MAARKRNWQTNKTREKIRDSIKVGQVIKRFENHSLRDKGDPEYVELSQTQIAAGKALMDRTLPVLSSAEIVENEQPPSIDQALEQLKQLVGPEIAKALSTKEGMKAIADLMNKNVNVEEVLVHEQPEQTQ